MNDKTLTEGIKLVAIVVAAAVVTYAVGIHVTRWLILSLTESREE
jgi:hypothetical protein